MRTGTPLPSTTPAEPDMQRKPLTPPAQPTAMALHQCTAENPGLVVNEQCSTVLKETSSQWKYKARGGDWFCGVAMLAPPEMQTAAAQ